MDNIFDLSNTKDIPDSVLSQLRGSSLNGNDRMIVSLFELKNELSVDEILIGLFRKYSVEKKKSWIGNRLYALSKNGKIERVEKKKGLYRLKK